MISPGKEPAAFRLVVYCLNQVRYGVTNNNNNFIYISNNNIYDWGMPKPSHKLIPTWAN
jgi:hypothetical protein